MGRDKPGVLARFLERDSRSPVRQPGLSSTNCVMDWAKTSHSYFVVIWKLTKVMSAAEVTPKPRAQGQHPNRSLVVLVVEKKPAPKNENGQRNHAAAAVARSLRRQRSDRRAACSQRFRTGQLPEDNVAAKSHLMTDGFAGYQGRKAALGEHLKHTPVRGGRCQCRRVLSDRRCLVQHDQSMARRHLPRRLRQASVALSVQIDLSLQPRQSGSGHRPVSDPPCGRVHHHLLQPSAQKNSILSMSSSPTCFGWIGRIRLINFVRSRRYFCYVFLK